MPLLTLTVAVENNCPPSLPQPPCLRPAPRGIPVNPTLLHPELPVQATLGRSPPCARARQRGCRTAREAREAPKGRLHFISGSPVAVETGEVVERDGCVCADLLPG